MLNIINKQLSIHDTFSSLSVNCLAASNIVVQEHYNRLLKHESCDAHRGVCIASVPEAQPFSLKRITAMPYVYKRTKKLCVHTVKVRYLNVLSSLSYPLFCYSPNPNSQPYLHTLFIQLNFYSALTLHFPCISSPLAAGTAEIPLGG